MRDGRHPGARQVSAPTRTLRSATASRAVVRLPGLAIGTLLLVVFAVVVLAPSVSTLLDQRQRIVDLRAEVAARRAGLAQEDADIARWDDPAYVRAQAGTRLFYVLPGETVFRVTGAPAGAADGSSSTRPAARAARTRPDWTRTLLDSLVTAGTTVEPEARLPASPAGG